MGSMFKIFTEQLRDGRKEKIDLTIAPDFLDMHEAEISLSSPVEIRGEAYVTETHLIFHLDAKVEIVMPCAICNQPTSLILRAQNIYSTLPLDTLPSTIYDYRDLIREELVLLVPQFIECQKGRCPARADLEHYTKKPDVPSPFANLPMP